MVEREAVVEDLGDQRRGDHEFSVKNPILFLDFDGVLNHEKMLRRWIRKTGDNDGIDVYSARALQKILDISGADVVISSTWRKYYTDEQLKFYLSNRGCPRINIIGRTPEIFHSNRGAEIIMWLNENHVDRVTGTYVILDDDISVGDIPELKNHWVQTYYEDTGLRSCHVPVALQMLGLK